MGSCEAGHPDAEASRPLPDLGPDYVVTKRLGRGAFAEVYEVVSTLEGAPFTAALKLANMGDLVAQRLLAHEARVLAQLDIPEVARLRGQGSTGRGDPFIVLDRVQGPTFAVCLARTPRRDAFAERKNDVLAICEAVAKVHGRGWIHGDLKPENLMMGGPAGVTILDFGLARHVSSERSLAEKTLTGTVEYMSPEQCTTGANLDERSDIYALGVLIYEVVFGHPPFVGREEEVREAHRSERVPLLGKRRPIDRLLLSCLAKDPMHRPPSAESLKKQLLEAWACDALEVDRATSRPQELPLVVIDREEAVAVLFFQSQRSVDGLLSILQTEGGQIVDLREDRRVVVFRAGQRENPAMTALRVAERLVRKGVASGIVVDVVSARVRARACGGPRISSPAFLDASRFPIRSMGPGIFATEAARSRLLSCRFEPIESHGTWRVLAQEGAGDVGSSPARMVGRDALRAEVVASTADVRGGCPVLCTVVGEAGIGKTCLLRAVEGELRAAGQWLAVRLAPSEPLGSVPRSITPRLVGELCGLGRDLTPDDAELVSEWVGEAFMAQHGLGLAFALGWIGPEDTRLAKLKNAPGALQSMAAFALGEFLRQTSSVHPTAILLDNAQYAEQLLLSAIEYATRPENPGRLWVCVAARDGFFENPGRRAWAAAAPRAHRFEVSALSPGEAEELVRLLLEPIAHPPVWVLQQIARRAGGHPLLLRELVEGLKGAGLVRPGERGDGFVLQTEVLDGIPSLPLVDWLLSRELERLPHDMRTFAALVAAMGPEIDAEQLAGIVERFEEDGVALPFRLEPTMGLLRLMAAGILRARNHRYVFRHEALRKKLAEDIPGPLKTAWHKAAYSYFQLRRSERSHETRLQLAHHAAHAGLRSHALEHQLALAEMEESRHAYHEAEAHYGRALEFCPQGSPLHRLAWHRRGVLRYRLGLYEGATDALEIALELARSLGEVATEVSILLDSATVWDWREDHVRSAALVEQAAMMIGPVSTALLDARLTLARGRTCFRHEGDAHHACELLLEAARKAEVLGEEGYETRVIAMLLAAPLSVFRGEVERAKALFGTLIVLCQEHQDAMHLATVYNNRAALWDALQDDARTLEDLQRVIVQSRTYGFSMLEAFAMRNVAEINYMLSNYEEALVWADSSIVLGQKLSGDGQRVQIALLMKARIHAALGNLAAAATLVSELRTKQLHCLQAGRTDSELLPPDEVLCRMVELLLEDAPDERWSALLQDAEGETKQGERVESLEFWALAAIARGQHDAALERLRCAAALLDVHPMALGKRIRARIGALEAGGDAWPERSGGAPRRMSS